MTVSLEQRPGVVVVRVGDRTAHVAVRKVIRAADLAAIADAVSQLAQWEAK